MSLSFEWDARKAQSNLRKHGVSFEEAVSVFGDRFSRTIPDPLHSQPGEDRYVTLGETVRRRLVVVVHCDRGARIRIISVRKATPYERAAYEG